MSGRIQMLEGIANGDAPEEPYGQQLEMWSLFQEVRERYADFTRGVELELSRHQVAVLANMVAAHRADDVFCSDAEEGYKVMEWIVRQWCAAARKSNGQFRSQKPVMAAPRQARPVVERLNAVALLILNAGSRGLSGAVTSRCTANFIAAELDVSSKTIRRDVDFLRKELGHDIYYDARAWSYRYAHKPLSIGNASKQLPV